MPRLALVARTSTALASLTLAAACADKAPTSPDVAPSALKAIGRSGAATPARYVVQFAPSSAVALPAATVAASGGTLAGAVPVARGLVVAGVTNPSALAA
ncbi:MAG TPA: hypothetical protein VGD56_03260, partial [Gemmatirosa sp.]